MKYLKLCLLPLSCFLAFGQDTAPSTPDAPAGSRSSAPRSSEPVLLGQHHRQVARCLPGSGRRYAGRRIWQRRKTLTTSAKPSRSPIPTTSRRPRVRENCHGEYRWHNSHIPATIPLTSTWKVVDGQWYWYWLKPTEVMTPWGSVHRSRPDAPTGTGATTVNTNVDTVVKDPASMAKAILSQVKVDKKEIHLLGYEPRRMSCTSSTPCLGRFRSHQLPAVAGISHQTGQRGCGPERDFAR